MELLENGRVTALHDACLPDWYAEKPGAVEPEESLESIVRAQHFCNVSLWDLEYEARRTDVDDHYIADIKRAIDGCNQRRNDLVERVDQHILEAFRDTDLTNSALNSESAGMMIDRLSILSLKIHHMGIYARTKEDPRVAQECAEKQAVLRGQREDLQGCLEALVRQFRGGQRHFKSYKQFKAYNDARLNPALANSGDA